MDDYINEKYRPELKSYFLAYSIPTQKNFEDLIDAMIIQGEDPLAVLPESPLMIKTSGDDQNRQEFIRFCENFEEEDTNPWILAQNPVGDGPEGFEITTPGTTRLFIDANNSKLGINTADPKGQLDVTVSDTTIIPLAITEGAANYLSISSHDDNNKVVIGGDFSDNYKEKAKLHVTLSSNDNTINPLVIERPAGDGNDFLSINGEGLVSINTETGDAFIEEQLNVRGNIKAGLDTAPFYLKNNSSDNDPTLLSTAANQWLKIISKSKLAFWTDSDEPLDRSNPNLFIGDGNIGIGTDTPGVKLEVSGGTKIDGAMEITGAGTFASTIAVTGEGTFGGGNLTVNGTGIEATSGKLLLAGNNGVEIHNGNTLDIDSSLNEIIVGKGSSTKLRIWGGLYIDGNGTPVDFNKLNSISTIQFHTSTVTVHASSGSGSNTATASFPPDAQVEAAIKGWKLRFDDSTHHEIKELKIELGAPSTTGVSVSASLIGGKNDNEDWTATVTVLFIAKVSA